MSQPYRLPRSVTGIALLLLLLLSGDACLLTNTVLSIPLKPHITLARTTQQVAARFQRIGKTLVNLWLR
jgi:hypothetical protein